MPYLDAALAFAVTMLILATVVTKLVDIVHGLLQFLSQRLKKWLQDPQQWFTDRATIFQKMLEDFLTKELSKIAARELDVNEARAEQMGRTALNEITTAVAGGRTLTQLSNADLVDKLKQTDLGKQLLDKLDAVAAPVFDEISRRYAAIEKEYTETFRKNARLHAWITALVLALLLNIDSINILRSYIASPTLSAKIAAKSDKAMADYNAMIARITPGDPTPVGFPEAKKAADEAVSQLTSGDLPFGWSYFPYTRHPQPSKDITDQQPPALGLWNRTLALEKVFAPWILWVTGIVLTVLLAGLGAPFWHDAIRGINQMASAGSKPEPPPPTPVVVAAPVADG